jgi:transposase
MAYNFLHGDHDQPYLLPPDLRDWLPADHLAWFVRDVVAQLDLGPFLSAYRADGHGHPAYDPKTLLGVLLYAYATGVRSSRQIQRRCIEDLAFRALAGNQAPDHVTIARFRVRHEQALAGFLVQSLQLCQAAGLVRLGVVALDGTKMAANAADRANRTLAKLQDEVAQILEEAAEVDQVEDHEHGPARGMSSRLSWRAPAAGWRGCKPLRRGWRPRRPNAGAADAAPVDSLAAASGIEARAFSDTLLSIDPFAEDSMVQSSMTCLGNVRLGAATTPKIDLASTRTTLTGGSRWGFGGSCLGLPPNATRRGRGGRV